MTTQIPAPPQLVTNSRMLYFGWVPADPDAVARLVHPGLEPNGNVFMNQYVVDRPEQASGFGAYSLTYIGSDLVGQDADENTPGRWWTHYFNSSPRGARVRGRARRAGRARRDGRSRSPTAS